MRPTLRAWLLVLLGVPVSLLAALVHERLWTVWAGTIGGVAFLMAMDAFLSPRASRARASAAVPDRLFAGDSDPMPVTVTLPRAASVEVLAEVEGPVEPPRVARVRVAAGVPAQVDLTLVPRRRGQVTVKRLWLRWSGPLGLVRRQRAIAVEEIVRVVPNVRAVKAAAMRLFARGEGLGMKVERTPGDGSEFDALREHAPGMDIRTIDWKHSARHRKLVAKEYRAERNHQIIVAIDCGHLMSEPLAGIPRLDHAINAALLLAYVALRTGDRVGLYSFDAEPRGLVDPAAGVATFPRLERVTADLAYRQVETNFTLGLTELSRSLGRRSLVVLLTDFVDTVTAELMLENVTRLARRHLVVFVTLHDPELATLKETEPRTGADVGRAVVAGDLLRERDVVHERLRRVGVHCLDVAPGKLSPALLERYLDIKRRELIA